MGCGPDYHADFVQPPLLFDADGRPLQSDFRRCWPRSELALPDPLLPVAR